MDRTAVLGSGSAFAAITRALRFVPLIVALPLAILLALSFGTASISLHEIVEILGHRTGLAVGPGHFTAADDEIIWNIRFPRVAAAALVGAALATAGTLFQAVLRNPLADPYVIGTSAGAQLGVTIAIIVPLQFSLLGYGPLQLLAFVGALGTVLLVYALARTGGATPVVTLILAGFVVSSFLISTTSFLTALSSRMSQIVGWTMGGVAVTGWGQLGVAAPLLLLGFTGALLLAPRLDALQLGEEAAGYLGVRVELVKLIAVVIASLITALAVTLAGVVAFVGLVVPHAARLIYGPSHRALVPVAAIGGATFVVLVDLIARTLVAPTELPLGVMTAVIGAPFFLYLLRKGRREYAV